MEQQKVNISSDSYRVTSSFEEGTDEEIDEDESRLKDDFDSNVSADVSCEAERQSCNAVRHTPSPNTSPVTLRKNQFSPKVAEDKIAVGSDMRLSNFDVVDFENKGVVNSSSSVLRRKGIHYVENQRDVRSSIFMPRETHATTRKIHTNLEKSKILHEKRELPQQNNCFVGSSLWNWTLVALIVFISVIAMRFARRRAEVSPDIPDKPNDVLNEFLQAFDELNSSFPTQGSTFWKVLRAGTRSIVVPVVPEQPAVFIVAFPKDAQQTALCIVRKYASIVTKAFNGRKPIEFTHHLRGGDTPQHIKKLIDDTLNHGFATGSLVAIIHELQMLHGESAMMFHGYCDNDNAPFTRVAIVFMLPLDPFEEETDDLVEKKLLQVWGNYLDNDKLFPLLSRIGNRNAFVRKESSEVLSRNACL